MHSLGFYSFFVWGSTDTFLFQSFASLNTWKSILFSLTCWYPDKRFPFFFFFFVLLWFFFLFRHWVTQKRERDKEWTCLWGDGCLNAGVWGREDLVGCNWILPERADFWRSAQKAVHELWGMWKFVCVCVWQRAGQPPCDMWCLHPHEACMASTVLKKKKKTAAMLQF